MHKQRSFAELFPERDARWGRNFPFRVGSAWQEEQFVIATRKPTIITKGFQNEGRIQMNRRLLTSSVPTNSRQRDSHLQSIADLEICNAIHKNLPNSCSPGVMFLWLSPYEFPIQRILANIERTLMRTDLTLRFVWGR